MRDSFYMVLSSNTSKYVFPNNVATHFTTQLPQGFCLHGEWCVALTEIQIPLTFQHISIGEEEGVVCVRTSRRDQVSDNDLHFEKDREAFSQVKSGVYHNIDTLLMEINSLDNVKGHMMFEIQSGGYIQVTCTCTDNCEKYIHTYTLSDKLRMMLGFENQNLLSCNGKRGSFIISDRPANLASGLPNILMIYSSICEPYVTGDTHTRLLRVVSLHLREYTYGTTEIQNFSSPMYLPLLSSSFQAIEIDIKNEYGKFIPFDYGTLTVTLHFKRIS